MEIARQMLHRLGRWEYIWLCLLVIVILALHFSTIMQPAEPVFDEEHYVTDARSILQGEGTLRLEHPPLGKLLITFGIFLFGDNPLGWRFFSILFGAVCIVFFYLVCRQLAMPKRASLLATFLLALDNLSFVQASVAMLDVYSLAFMLVSFWLYLKGRYLISGVSIGLSALAKLSGALALPAILLHWLLARRTHPWQFVISMLLAPVSFLLLMPLCDFVIFRQFVNPIARILTMQDLLGSLTFITAAHESASRPWDWILGIAIVPYWYQPDYLGAISFTIWALIIPSVLYMIFRAVRHSDAGIFGVSWFAGTYLTWIPVSIITDRISFAYYFYPTVGAICIGLGLGLSKLVGIWNEGKRGKMRWVALLAAVAYLLIHMSFFVILSPVFT